MSGGHTVANISDRINGRFAAGFIDADTGLSDLVERLNAGTYEVGVPEEGAFLVVANQRGDDVITLRRDPDTGELEPTGARVVVSAPVCVCRAVHPA